MKPREQDFHTFYYTKVGLGEGCGCAERVIDLHEVDRKTVASPVRRKVGPRHAPGRWYMLLAALGLTRRR